MKRFTSMFLISLLLGIVIFTSSCDISKTQSVVTCFSKVVVSVVVSTTSDVAGPLAIVALNVIPDCINAAIAVFSPPGNPTPSTPEVEIHTSLTDTTSTEIVEIPSSQTLGRCTDSPSDEVFNFNIPFQMFVHQERFSASPGGTTDYDLIAQRVFQQHGNYIASVTTSGPSVSIAHRVPAHTIVRPTLRIKLSYRTGEARVVHTDGSMATLPWLFTNGYQPDGNITWDTRSCQHRYCIAN